MTLPAISPTDAKLPAAYEAAKTALANCEQVDECKDWADKAEALASYAKQAGDDVLRKHADRIQARAIRRCGELLKQFDGRGGDTTKNDGGGTFAATRRGVAEAAGMSKRQQVTAVRLSNVPLETFDDQVDSAIPPTVTRLADMGRKPRPVIELGDRNPDDFNKAMHFKGMLSDYSRELAAWSIPDVIPRLVDADRAEVRKLITQIDAVHDNIITRI